MDNITYKLNEKIERNSITMNDFYILIDKYISSDTILNIIDAGTMDGNDAIFFKNKYPKANVYAIEGLPNNYTEYLCNTNHDIIPINSVITNYDGHIQFYQKNINGIHSIFDRGSSYGDIVLNLPCHKLSTLMTSYGINSIDVLKIDVEGATLELLEGLDEYIYDIKIMHIETETYPFFQGQRLHNEVCEFLLNKNFTLIDITFAEITTNNYQSDSVWINNKLIDNKLI